MALFPACAQLLEAKKRRRMEAEAVKRREREEKLRGKEEAAERQHEAALAELAAPDAAVMGKGGRQGCERGGR